MSAAEARQIVEALRPSTIQNPEGHTLVSAKYQAKLDRPDLKDEIDALREWQEVKMQSGRYQATIRPNQDGYFVLVVKEQQCIHGLAGRHYQTLEAAEKGARDMFAKIQKGCRHDWGDNRTGAANDREFECRHCGEVDYFDRS